MTVYPKNQTPQLDEALFRNPTAEYRATPFWAWNGRLKRDELLRQIDGFKAMGFGGFHMHCRVGLDTPYFSEEFFDCIKACRDRAREQDMLCHLYDEAGYPSGYAGGLVTCEPRYRVRRLRVTAAALPVSCSREEAVETGERYLVGAYDVTLDSEGCLAAYKTVGTDTPPTPHSTRFYAYCETPPGSGWYNGYTSLNTMEPSAVKRFVTLTVDAYKKAVGEDFGGLVPSIFTDEPAMSELICLHTAAGTDCDALLHWTPDLPESFKAAFGYDLVARLPEVLWQSAGNIPSQVRWHYHDHTAERFAAAFADQYGAYCEKNGLFLTGHVLNEDYLQSQTYAVGEAMRSYRSFGIPGIDMLDNALHFTTAKQTQSAVRQYGREAMMSELYGCTGWEFDFRGHKFQGDWQAALGVTMRVPHLAWYTMKGVAKRDYPASISYQSSWHKEYKLVEDHFARLATVLTRGKPLVSIGVIHPIESDWLLWGPAQQTEKHRQTLQAAFAELTQALLKHLLDFDFICESQLPSLAKPVTGAAFTVGEMTYTTLIVPDCLTLRSSTMDRLEQFAEQGGQLIFAGRCPAYVDALPSDRPARLYARSRQSNGDCQALCDHLENCRAVAVTENGRPTDNLLYQLRQDGDVRWLFLARCTYPEAADTVERRQLTISLPGEYTPTLYRTVTGEVMPLPYRIVDGHTYIEAVIYNSDSLLIRLSSPTSAQGEVTPPRPVTATLPSPAEAAIQLDEENMLLLDFARCRLDDGEETAEPVLNFANRVRKALGYVPICGDDCRQPWTLPDAEPTHTVTLTFSLTATAALQAAVACENVSAITLNGKAVSTETVGYYVDRAIRKTAPVLFLQKGENTLVLQMPMGEKYWVENAYLLGDFGVECHGKELILTPPVRTLHFGDITAQGLPFYGGTVTYSHSVTTPDGQLRITLPHYEGALVRVALDGQDSGAIAFAPYQLTVPVTAGEHTLTYRLFCHRENGFGRVVHNLNRAATYHPGSFFPSDKEYSPAYHQLPLGLMAAPVLEMVE